MDDKKLYQGEIFEFILEHPVKIEDVVNGFQKENFIVRTLFERINGGEKPVFVIQKKKQNGEAEPREI